MESEQRRSLNERLAAAREDYARGGLAEEDLASDPIAMFTRWYDEVAAAGIHEPNAMVVASVGPDGAPSTRMVLLKGVQEGPRGEGGFVFFTNLESRKGAELAAEPRTALLFPWHPLERQVRVEGVAEELSRADVDAYFASRPRGSQVGAWASPQSRVVSGRSELARSYAAAEERFAGLDVPVPPQWGGFVVRPLVVEFWQGRPGRMHDRLVYRRTRDAWLTERLAP